MLDKMNVGEWFCAKSLYMTRCKEEDLPLFTFFNLQLTGLDIGRVNLHFCSTHVVSVCERFGLGHWLTVGGGGGGGHWGPYRIGDTHVVGVCERLGLGYR